MITDNIIILIAVLLQCILVASIFKYRKRLDEQNKKLIQFYLDAKFICKHLIESITISDSSSFCTSLLHEIKEYYNLDDILVVDSISSLNGENNTKNRSSIIKYIHKNINEINQNIVEHQLLKVSAAIEGRQKVLYISALMGKDEGNGMVICIEDAPCLLTEQGKTSLENCINLLKTRLLYE